MFKFLRLTLILTFLLTAAGVMPVAGQLEPGPDPLTPTTLTNMVYLPLTMNRHQSFELAGQVTDETGNPLPGVVLSNGAGMTATTDINGNYSMGVTKGEYSVAALQEGIGFLPPAMDLEVQENVSTLDFTGSDCEELIPNGDFETDDGWELENAIYSSLQFNGGARSLQLGLLDPGSNSPVVSLAMSPAFTVPETAKDPQLRLWLFTQSISASSKDPSKAQAGDNFFGPSLDQNDIQLVQILDANGQSLEPLLPLQGANSQEWGLVQFNLYKYTGQTIRLGFSVTNDGSGNTTALFVDDASLVTCPTVFAPEGFIPETSSPDACANQVINPGFEALGGWNIPYTAYPAGYNNSAAYPNTVYAGAWSMRTGIPMYLPWHNRYSYSDAWQTVYIPPSATSAMLSMQVKLVSTEAPYLSEEDDEDINLADTDPHFAPGMIWGEEPLAGDSMYILILNPYTGAIRQALRSWPAKNNNWNYWEWDLLAYRGQHIRIQFGTYNDGWNGVTSMYIDEAYLNVCDGGLPPPPPPAVSCPAGWSERIVNNSFESNNGWYRPVTAYTARYTNWLWHTGARSMQTGIINPWHNRYSYSDFGQYVHIPSGVSSAILKFWVYRKSNDWYNYDKQYLLVLNNWGYWIDTLLWNNSNNSSAWVEITRDVTYLRGWPIRLQFGTYNNGWNGITSMFVDDVTLCTWP